MLRLNNLFEFPFLRFDDVKLYYNGGSHPIANKCEIFASQLQKLPRLNQANSICVWANINQKGGYYFIDDIQFLDHLRNRLLPICGYCRQYKFRIGLKSDYADNYAVTNIIPSILQMQQVNECSNVVIHFGEVRPIQFDYRLAVETISNWLHRNKNTDNDGKEFANQNHQGRVLSIEAVYISNVLEIVNHLKKVFNFCDFL